MARKKNTHGLKKPCGVQIQKPAYKELQLEKKRVRLKLEIARLDQLIAQNNQKIEQHNREIAQYNQEIVQIRAILAAGQARLEKAIAEGQVKTEEDREAMAREILVQVGEVLGVPAEDITYEGPGK
ncbi:MAG TPA: hypothetical protein VH593_05760 [Ktedonobacteraceae bacterium]|jgi:chromosome segregation ATPase